MKKTFFVFALCASALFTQAQSLSPQVIASAGDYYDNGTISLSWTLGEPAVETYTSANLILTQGFQQPELLTVGIKNTKKENLFANLYPNPTFKTIKLDLKYSNSSTLNVQLMNTLGQIIKTENFDVVKNQLNNYQLDLDGLSAGMYQIRLTDNGKLVETYKIQKLEE
jgi:hypothetical protein